MNAGVHRQQQQMGGVSPLPPDITTTNPSRDLLSRPEAQAILQGRKNLLPYSRISKGPNISNKQQIIPG